MSLNPRRSFWTNGPILSAYARDCLLRLAILAAGLTLAAAIYGAP